MLAWVVIASLSGGVVGSRAFVQELEASNQVLLAKLGDIGAIAGEAVPQADVVRLLKIALVNEISVSELAAAWMPPTAELDVKIALAQQAGDEARHFKLIEKRLEALGVSLAEFSLPGENPLFGYLKSLHTTVEKIAAGQFTLESIAFQVNQNFMKYCELSGDSETVKIYQQFIQPDELFHHQLGKTLLEKYATTTESQQRAREAARKTLEIAAEWRGAAARRIGTSCFPGC